MGFSENHPRLWTFLNGFMLGAGLAVTGFEPNLFPVLAGIVCGFANIYRVSKSSETGLREWKAAGKHALFSGIAAYGLSGFYAGWFGIGFVSAGAVSLLWQYIRRKSVEKSQIFKSPLPLTKKGSL